MFPILTSGNRLMNTFVTVFPYKQSRQESEHSANG